MGALIMHDKFAYLGKSSEDEQPPGTVLPRSGIKRSSNQS